MITIWYWRPEKFQNSGPFDSQLRQIALNAVSLAYGFDHKREI